MESRIAEVPIGRRGGLRIRRDGGLQNTEGIMENNGPTPPCFNNLGSVNVWSTAPYSLLDTISREIYHRRKEKDLPNTVPCALAAHLSDKWIKKRNGDF